MSDLLPEGEDLRRAVRWISEERARDPSLRLAALVEAASRRFNLDPLAEEYLLRTLAAPAQPPREP